MPSKEFIKIWKILERVAKQQEAANKRQDRIDQEIDKVNKEIDRVNKEIDKVNKEVDKVNKMVGNLTDGWGKFVVGLFEPSVEDCIKDLGFEVISVLAPPKRRINNIEFEIDLLVISKLNGKPKILVIEVKSSVNQQKIDNFIKNKLPRFKEFFFEYKDMDLIGGFAGVRFFQNLRDYALNRGLYIFGTAKGIMKNLTPSGFQPKIW
jgi:hypothetical protein